MNCRTLNLLLAFCVVLGDGLPLFAAACQTSLQVIDCHLSVIPIVVDHESNHQSVPDQLGRQLRCEPFEECDADDLSDALPMASMIGSFHDESWSNYCFSVRYELTSRISIHLRI